jgi:hypothetical protein
MQDSNRTLLELDCINMLFISVIPAKAGIQDFQGFWPPAFAGVTTHWFS